MSHAIDEYFDGILAASQRKSESNPNYQCIVANLPETASAIATLRLVLQSQQDKHLL
ncbi:hypothetical protein [Pseudosulfitobacter sp. DSM 107133]|jgi:hypothetical protein|uniref:hypothetical protein n=1 Tax=Pseudosulfitobacter sp. DSM 107133 TaxID=2883100 RepID=UPI0013B45A61|nr:hypothetical protein [Pseudosulfitobacter sp. DSM 107133]